MPWLSDYFNFSVFTLRLLLMCLSGGWKLPCQGGQISLGEGFLWGNCTLEEDKTFSLRNPFWKQVSWTCSVRNLRLVTVKFETSRPAAQLRFILEAKLTTSTNLSSASIPPPFPFLSDNLLHVSLFLFPKSESVTTLFLLQNDVCKILQLKSEGLKIRH